MTGTTPLLSLETIHSAAEMMAAHGVVRTPTVPVPHLGAGLGCEIALKLETLQVTGSFKVRGALVKLASLSAEQRRRGVVAMSAGNHAQGVAYHAGRLGVPATVVMPRATPFTKVRNTETLGARVVLHGETLSEAETEAQRLAETEGLAFIQPYDDPAVIAGQGTVGLELMQDAPWTPDAVVVPVGGGGLIGGTAMAVKGLNPETEVIGVEAALYASMTQAVKGTASPCRGETIAEGIAVKRPGALTRPLVEHLVDDLVTVGETDLERAVQMLLDRAKVVAEGAGAAALASLLVDPERFRGCKVVLVVSGGNIDDRLLTTILMRGLFRDQKLIRLRIAVPDHPGALAEAARHIGAGGGNILQIRHQRLFLDVPAKTAEIDVLLETRDAHMADDIVARLEEAGLSVRRLPSSADRDE